MIYVNSEKEKEMLKAYLDHVYYDVLSIKDLYLIGTDIDIMEVLKELNYMRNAVLKVGSIVQEIDAVDYLIKSGKSDEEIANDEGINVESVKRCRKFRHQSKTEES